MQPGHLSEVENEKKGLSLDKAEALSEALNDDRVLDAHLRHELAGLGFDPALAEVVVEMRHLEDPERHRLLQEMHDLLAAGR